ncbi:MAG: carbohydrate binding domain-containing protein [Gemmataceae bacterium]
MKRTNLLLAALALLLGVDPARADLIVNGGFETGDLTGWTVGPNPSFPVSVDSAPAVVHSGLFAAQIAGFSSDPDTLSQTVLTTTGQHYTLSFWRTVLDGGPITSLAVFWDNTLLFSEMNNGAQPYSLFTFDVVGTGSDTLRFVSANDPSFTFLDDVSLVPTHTPEPTSLVIFGLAAVAAGCFGRRRGRQPV